MIFRWLALIFLFFFVYHVREVFPPFVVGGIFAYLLLPGVNWFSRKLNMPIGASVALVYVLIAALLFGLGYWFGPLIIGQSTHLVQNREQIVERLVQQTATAFHWQVDIAETSTEILSALEQAAGKPEEIVHVGGLISKSLLSVLVCVVSSIYFIVDSSGVGQFFLRFMPADKRESVTKLTARTNLMLSKYVRGQLLLIAIMFVVTYGFLHLGFKLNYALLIALASAFLEIIPVLGPILAITIATIVGVAQLGVGVALPIIGCYWIARLIEDYIIVPRVIGHAVELHPLAVIFAVLCGETMAGALGMLIAIPVAASFKEVLDEFYPISTRDEHGQNGTLAKYQEKKEREEKIERLEQKEREAAQQEQREHPTEPPATLEVPSTAVKIDEQIRKELSE